MDLSNEDILELINRLLERLHQTDEDKESRRKSLEPTNRRSQNLPVHQPVNHPNYQNH